MLAASAAAAGDLPTLRLTSRKTTSKDLAVSVERYVTPNGLTVLLSPDPRVNQVVVDVGFAAGALYQPPAKSGLAHLVEHLMATGATPETDYMAMLERRGGTGFNAVTTFDRMTFRVIVPPEELPLALWVAGDRLGTLPGQLDQAELDKSRKIVVREFVERVEDVPFGSSAAAVMGRLFPPRHPLHHGIIGTPATLAALSLADVREFIGRTLVPANGVLTIVGNFDPKVAREWVDKSLARLPGGQRAPKPQLMALEKGMSVAVTEKTSRRPRVTLAWAFSEPTREVVESLSYGALLLSLYTDGFLGMSVGAEYVEFEGGGLFLLQVTMAHGVDTQEAGDNAEAMYRYLSQAMMPVELVSAVFQALDRLFMEQADSPPALASLLTRMEVLPSEAIDGFAFTERHWRLTAQDIQVMARAVLNGPRLAVYAKPTRPLPRKELK